MNQDIEMLQFFHYKPEAKRAEIGSALYSALRPATLKRLIAVCVSKEHIEVIGRGLSTRYKLSPQVHVAMELNLDTYFDERQYQELFNYSGVHQRQQTHCPNSEQGYSHRQRLLPDFIPHCRFNRLQ